jgi:hypothetical protein
MPNSVINDPLKQLLSLLLTYTVIITQLADTTVTN